MKNKYVIETIETCKVWKQYSVEAYTMEQATEMVKSGDLYESGNEIDHYIDHDIGVDKVMSIKHCGVVGEE